MYMLLYDAAEQRQHKKEEYIYRKILILEVMLPYYVLAFYQSSPSFP